MSSRYLRNLVNTSDGLQQCVSVALLAISFRHRAIKAKGVHEKLPLPVSPESQIRVDRDRSHAAPDIQMGECIP